MSCRVGFSVWLFTCSVCGLGLEGRKDVEVLYSVVKVGSGTHGCGYSKRCYSAQGGVLRRCRESNTRAEVSWWVF